MHKSTYNYLTSQLNIKRSIIDLMIKCETDLKKEFDKINEIKEFNQYKVLDSMKKNRLSDMHFKASTGYGYGDTGRETLDKIFADIFNSEDALVRTNITSGTHAISLCLYGLLKPGDEMLSITGKPYDTLDEIIGISNQPEGCLKNYNISYNQIESYEDSGFDFNLIEKSINNKTKMVFMQRSAGYNWRKALTINEIKQVISFIKDINPNIYCMVDNCYGEFVEFMEPTAVNADIIAGSLIKNPGGSIAPTGGYVAGKKDLVELAANRLIAPGIGKECGATLGFNRLLFQGLFIAPHIVAEALKGAVLCSKVFSFLGYEVNPLFDSQRSDIVQAIKFKDEKKLILFCQGIQSGSPVDSFAVPEPWDMPGYNEQVIMASGGFVQGSSIELSADAPVKPPYIGYLQGGVTYEHVKIGLMFALQNLADNDLLLI